MANLGKAVVEKQGPGVWVLQLCEYSMRKAFDVADGLKEGLENSEDRVVVSTGGFDQVEQYLVNVGVTVHLFAGAVQCERVGGYEARVVGNEWS